MAIKENYELYHQILSTIFYPEPVYFIAFMKVSMACEYNVFISQPETRFLPFINQIITTV